MFTLSNDQLSVKLLDPAIDRARFGARYCTGGYIFQVSDRQLGDLMTGPTFPESFNVFDGQGIPDSFSRAPLRDPSDPTRALVIGVGLCRPVDAIVDEFCTWDVDTSDETVLFQTRQLLPPFGLTLRREVSLRRRTIRSLTEVVNTGSVGFQISWFPHPFFPQPEDDELCRVSTPVDVRDNEGYERALSGFIRRRGWPWQTDHYLALDHQASSPLTVLQRHPKVGLVAGSTSYVPRFLPIWGNPNTFSWEPYFENTIAPGQRLSWWMTYDF